MRRVRAAVAHTVPDRPALRTVVGQWVDLGPRDDEWPEFVFVRGSGGAGWVPARYLSEPIGGRASVTQAYDATELATKPGELLDAIDEDVESGWIWCRSAGGREGWVPAKTLEWTEPPAG